MSGITIVCIFALAQAINTAVIPPEIDQLNSLNIPKAEFEAEHNGLITDYSKTTRTNKGTPEGCSRTEGAYICDGNEAGKPIKTSTEAECAAYCWGTEGCQFWLYMHGYQGSVNCGIKTASNCTGPNEGSTWGSRQWSNNNNGLPTGP